MLIVALFAATAAVHFHFIVKTVFQSWLSLHCNSSGSLSLSLAKCQATRASQTKLGLRLQIKCITRNIPLFLSLLFSLLLSCSNSFELHKQLRKQKVQRLSLLLLLLLSPFISFSSTLSNDTPTTHTHAMLKHLIH